VRSANKASYAARSGQWFWRRVFDTYGAPVRKENHAVWNDFDLLKQCFDLEGQTPGALEFNEARCDLSVEVPDRFVLLHPSTRWKRKRWPAQCWGQLASRLSRRGIEIVLSSGPDSDEIEFCRQIKNYAGEAELNYTEGKLTWAQLAGVMRRAQLFVGVDTAAMHLAAACQLPVIGLFLPWMSEKWHPWKVDHEVLQATHFPGKAELGDPSLAFCIRAMETISVSSVAETVEKRWAHSK